MKEIATAHGGRVWVESVLGEGSTFYLALPQADTASTEHASVAVSQVAGGA